MGNNTSRENKGVKSSKYRSAITPFNSNMSLNLNKAGVMNRLRNTSKHKKAASLVNHSFEQSSIKTCSLHALSQPIFEAPLIEKYTDSQMTLLSNNSSQVDSIHTTNNSNSTLNIHISQNEMARAYSSEMMLKELYMLCETSPERTRDRDR